MAYVSFGKSRGRRSKRLARSFLRLVRALSQDSLIFSLHGQGLPQPQHPRLPFNRHLLNRAHRYRLSNLSRSNRLPRPPQPNHPLIIHSMTIAAATRTSKPRHPRRPLPLRTTTTPLSLVRPLHMDLPLLTTNMETMALLRPAGVNPVGMIITSLRLYTIPRHSTSQLTTNTPLRPRPFLLLHQHRLRAHCLLPPTTHPMVIPLHPLRIGHPRRSTRILLQLILRRMARMSTIILTLPLRCLLSTLTLNRTGTADQAFRLLNRLLPRVTRVRT